MVVAFFLPIPCTLVKCEFNLTIALNCNLNSRSSQVITDILTFFFHDLLCHLIEKLRKLNAISFFFIIHIAKGSTTSSYSVSSFSIFKLFLKSKALFPRFPI